MARVFGVNARASSSRIEPPVRSVECHDARARAGHAHARLVRVVVRLEEHHLVARSARPLDGGEDRLGRARRHGPLFALGVVETVIAPVLCRERRVHVRNARHPGVLPSAFTDGGNRRVLGEFRPVEVRKSLREVDGSVLDREPGHLGEDRGAETLEPAGERGKHAKKLSGTRTSPCRVLRFRIGFAADETEQDPLPRRHHRFRPRGLDRRALCLARGARARRFRGASARRTAHDHDGGGELSRLPRGHPGSRADGRSSGSRPCGSERKWSWTR